MNEAAFYEELGRRIRAAREAAGLSQQAVADALGYSHVAVLHWEHADTRPPLYTITRIEALLGVRLHDC